MTVTDTLPPGVTVIEAGYNVTYWNAEEVEPYKVQGWDCSGTGTSVLTCTSDPENLPSLPLTSSPYLPGGYPQEIGIVVAVAPGVQQGTLDNNVTVSGGGALGSASVSNPIEFSSTEASSFGFENFDGWFSNREGQADHQAGSHPYEVTFSYNLHTREYSAQGLPQITVAGGKDRTVNVNLPPGIVGDPGAVPQCLRRQLDEEECPPDTQIGFDVAPVASTFNSQGEGPTPFFYDFPVYNMVPPPGSPAEFAFQLSGYQVFIDSGVRSGSDYGITTHVYNIIQGPLPIANTITLWGEPADPAHDTERWSTQGCENGCSSNAGRIPFLTLPTSCEGPKTYTTSGNAWETAGLEEASFVSHDESHTPVGFTGCEHLKFTPTVSIAPDTTYSDTPAGLSVDVKVPQEGLSEGEGLAMSNIKNTTVVLPKGIVINPGQAAGLEACSTADSAVGTEGEAKCPAASKVGAVEIATPLLRDKITGNVYVLQSDPPHLKLLIAASADGVNVKLVGDVELNETTGQLTTTFDETPELPFTDFKLSFSSGAQAALATPTACGVYSSSADFTPWSTPYVRDSLSTVSFGIEHGPAGSPCSSPMPFTPTMIAGSTTDQAAGFTDFSLLLQRGDGQQRISSLQFKAPEGLLGMISKVPLCPEAQANAGTCSPASQIGHTVVEAGPGPAPLVVPQPGQPPAPIYLTAGYRGAPYGLSIVVPLHVGPFTLQTQVVRAKIEVDPLTAQITVTTDPLPQIVDGVPADLRTINAVIDRPGFMFNPSDCSPQEFSGTATSSEGATAPLSSHFQMGSCQSLTFKPNFKVSVSGKNSRKDGASLVARVIYPTGTPGNNQASSQSNIAKVKVDLPKQLPSRLSTLQKACTASQFNANPAGCPAASIVGHATAITPVLPVPVTGPAYFVSYGGAKFPELVVVLQGYGVTVYLHSETFINEKTGITSSTFRHVPDVPITSFELILPQGQFSALAANTNLCNVKGGLHMPTTFTGHNGAVIHQSTPISVSGCPKHKAKKAKKVKNTAGRGKKR